MNVSSLLDGLLDLRGAVVGDSAGALVEEIGANANSEEIAAVSGLLVREFSQIGDALGTGALEILVIKGKQSTRVIARQHDSVLAVELAPTRATDDLENRLRSTDWTTNADETEAATTDSPPETPAFAATDAQPESEALAEQNSADRAHLRRELVKGRLSAAESLGAKLFGSANPNELGPDGSPVVSGNALALSQLMKGIAKVLVGDSFGGLDCLGAIDQSDTIDRSLRWAARIWTIRTIVSAGDQPDFAAACRNAANGILELAAVLDVEARAITLCTLADVAALRHEGDAALAFLNKAGELFEALGDDQEIASTLLSQARVLAELGRHSESLTAAQRAHHHQPSWPPPVLFLARRALEAGRLDDSQALVQPLLGLVPRPVEVERIQRLLGMVRSGAISEKAAFDYLRLLEAQPSRQTILELESLCAESAEIPLFQEALGWKLFRSGEFARAAQLFEKLSQDPSLTADERSSVLLALGCLATLKSRNEKTGVKVRAAVMATPEELRDSGPVLDGETAFTGPQSNGSGPGWGGKNPPTDLLAAQQNNQTGPVFAGSLRLFCLPDLVEFLHRGQRTGTIVCSSNAGIGAVHLRNGVITCAASPQTPSIGEWLISQGQLTREQYEVAYKEQQETSSNPLFGAILVDRGLTSVENVRKALEIQVFSALREIMSWVDGDFAFETDESGDSGEPGIELALDPQRVFLNIFKEMDESAAGYTPDSSDELLGTL